MKFNKCLFLMPILLLGSCTVPSKEINIESLRPSKEEVSLILGSERNLNDIVTLIFEPNTIQNRKVTWSTEETEIFTLNGDVITTKQIGKGKVRATSEFDSRFFADITINVYNNSEHTYKVNIEESVDYSISTLNEEYYEGDEVSFSVNLLNDKKVIKEVKVDDTVLTSIDETNYKFVMPDKDVYISVILEDKKIPVPQEKTANYDIIYDLGERQTAKLIETNEDLFNTFTYKGQEISIIRSVANFEYIYGGGHGGRGETKWVKSNMLKLGTQSVNGYFILNLSTYVNKMTVKGFTSGSTDKLRVGDASSTDWSGSSFDNKTSEVTCDSLAIANKENMTQNVETSITIEFEKTKNLKIASTKKPIYITGIEFGFSN